MMIMIMIVMVVEKGEAMIVGILLGIFVNICTTTVYKNRVMRANETKIILRSFVSISVFLRLSPSKAVEQPPPLPPPPLRVEMRRREAGDEKASKQRDTGAVGMVLEDQLPQKHLGPSCSDISTRVRLNPKGARRTSDGASLGVRILHFYLLS
jgi:hypothetical protein